MKTLLKYLIKGILALLALLPLKVHYGLARFVAWLACSVLHYRTDDVMINFSRAFPEMNAYDFHDSGLKKRFYRHFANVIVETIWFGGCHNPERLRRSGIVRIANPELLGSVSTSSPGVVVMYTHCGNWELLGGLENYADPQDMSWVDEKNICVVYREMSSRVWDEVMRDNRFAPLRDKSGFSGYVESKQLVRYAFSHKDDHTIFCINTDQRPYFPGPGYTKVVFLHQECQTMSAAASLAHKFGFAVLYQRMRENPDGRGYVIEYVPICPDGREMSVEAMMNRYYELLEADIVEQPHNYLWTHRRWVMI